MTPAEVRNLKKGDLVFFTRKVNKNAEAFTYGKLYIFRGFDAYRKRLLCKYTDEQIDLNSGDNFILVEEDDKGSEENGWSHKYFRLPTLAEQVLYGTK